MSDENKKGLSGFYETFDSGSGPVVPEKASGDFAHNDSGSALSDAEGMHGAVPEVPSSK